MYAPVALRFHGYEVSLSGSEEIYVRTILDDEWASMRWLVEMHARASE